MQTALWSLVAIGVFVYAGYPLLLLAAVTLGRLRRSGAEALAGATPTVTLVVSAFNEQAVIADKIRNSLALDYPRALLKVLVVSDGSTDSTDAIVETFSPDGVELLRMTERAGKTAGLNEAVRLSKSDVLVFSDANAMYETGAVKALVARLADRRIGGVVGESGYVTGERESEKSEGLYWRYETMIKRLESLIGSVVGGDGAIYAIRRELYVPMKHDMLSDFVNPLQIVMAGHRCVYEPKARSFESAGDSFDKEFRRKVRIVNRAWRALWTMAPLLNPVRYGFFSIQLISHKLLRWLVPVIMIAVLALNILLVGRGAAYVTLLAAQLAFYVLAMAGHLLRGRAKTSRLLSIPYYFCMVNAASAIGILQAFRGRTYATWSTVRT